MKSGLAGNLLGCGPFSLHGNKTHAISILSCDGGLRRCGCPGPAWSDHSPGPDRAAITTRDQLRADAGAAAFRHRGAGRHHHWPAGRATWRQACPIRRRSMPAGRHRSRHARACAGWRQHAGDSAARQPRRRSLDPAQIAPSAGLLRRGQLCLTGPRPTSYMPRVRDCGM
jgi:hypothetical protein